MRVRRSTYSLLLLFVEKTGLQNRKIVNMVFMVNHQLISRMPGESYRRRLRSSFVVVLVLSISSAN